MIYRLQNVFLNFNVFEKHPVLIFGIAEARNIGSWRFFKNYL